MKFTESQLDEFGNKIGMKNGSLLVYIDEYYSFYKSDYPILVKYYKGELDTIKPDYYNRLLALLEKSSKVANLIDLNGFLLTTLFDFEIVDLLEDLRNEIYRMLKTSKFLRSSKTNTNFSNNFEFNSVKRQNSTLEDLVASQFGSINPDEDYVDVAVRNDLMEIDYKLDENKPVILQVSINSVNSEITCVVDNIIGEKSFGLDFPTQITFDTNIQDLTVLGYSETIKQAVKILSNLFKGDHPGFRDLGRNRIVGNNRYVSQYPTLFREFVKVFSSDDTLANLTIDSVEYSGDTIQLKFSVGTRLELVVNETVKI